MSTDAKIAPEPTIAIVIMAIVVISVYAAWLRSIGTLCFSNAFLYSRDGAIILRMTYTKYISAIIIKNDVIGYKLVTHPTI